MIIIAFGFLIYGILVFPPIHDGNVQKELDGTQTNLVTLNSENEAIGQTNLTIEQGIAVFDIPQFFENALYPTATSSSPIELSLNCTVLSYNFVQGNEFHIEVTITNGWGYMIDFYPSSFNLKPVNGIDPFFLNIQTDIMAIPPPGIFTESNLQLNFSTIEELFANNTVWKGSGDTILQNSGPIQFVVSGQFSIPLKYENNVDDNVIERFMEATYNFNTTVTLQMITIPSITQNQQTNLLNQTLIQQEILANEDIKNGYEQQISSDYNLALTCFILFFASFDIAIAVFGNSRNDKRESNYEEAKSERSHPYDEDQIGY